MVDRATFLHLTDTHLADAGVLFARDDHKVKIPKISPATRENVLTLLFRRLAERLTDENRRLDGVIFSGDAQNRGEPGGHKILLDLVLEHFAPFGINPEQIVATPGNHDVPRGSEPSSATRYKAFTEAWSTSKCKVPWLDGVDTWPGSGIYDRHRLVASDSSWAVYPLNTANWSHVSSVLPTPLRDVWDTIPESLFPTDPSEAEKIRSQLQNLAQYDMARVSEHQLEILRSIIASTPQPKWGKQLRIVVMHHHLRSPTLREEIKPFSDISNQEQVRALLRDSGISVAIHGHKHEHAAYFDHIYNQSGEDMHRTLVISGATFEVGRETEAARLITVNGLPHTQEISIEPIPLPRAGAEWHRSAPIIRRLWATTFRSAETVMMAPGAPITVEGSNLDEVYSRARAAALAEGKRSTLIVHLDLPDAIDEALPLPSNYSLPDGVGEDERQAWLNELVHWWQLDRSRLEHRIPYIHGTRLRRYGGKIDQIERIIALLRTKASTRAIAILIDPFRDFTPDGAREEFASFSLVEFRRRDADAGHIAIDAIAFYRAQEFERWWPINVAELRLLQREICDELGFRPGRITTIAADARTISRSPTQVAMPIIDRWLDQAPERLHLLANALIYQSVRGQLQSIAVRDWRRALAELRAATQAFNSDGIPVAIEGLRTLAGYIEASAQVEDPDLKQFARSLSDLANVNETFEHSRRGRASFNRWSTVAVSFLNLLDELTDTRLPDGKRL